MATGGAVVGFADLQEGVFAMEYPHVPPTVEVVAERACAYRAEAVEFTNVVELNGNHGFDGNVNGNGNWNVNCFCGWKQLNLSVVFE